MSDIKAPARFGVVHDGGLEKVVLERRLVQVKVEHVSADETRVWFLDPTTLLPFVDIINPMIVTADKPLNVLLSLPMRPTT